jgi:hypothetical protein
VANVFISHTGADIGWAGIELKRAVDVDADAAESMVGKYKQQVLKSV